MSDRSELARQQEELIEALLCGTRAPDEIDAERLLILATSLENKRARVLKKLAGESDTACGAIEENMLVYFKRYPGIHKDGGYADLKRYKRFLKLQKAIAFLAKIRNG